MLIKIGCLSTHAYGDLLFCYSFTDLNRRRGGIVSSKGLSSRHINPISFPEAEILLVSSKDKLVG